MTGKKLLEIAATRLGAKYVLGAIAPKSDKNYHGPFDCAEFTSWVVFQATGRLYGCANNSGDPNSADAYSGFWGRDADKLGIKISVAQALKTPGACLLRFARPGVIGHIVFSDGLGGTIEAHSTKKGTIKSTAKGRSWDIGVLVPWVQYDENFNDVKVVEPKGRLYRVAKPMMQDETVKAIQRKLCVEPVDGIFGAATSNAVRAYQLSKGLVPDGIAGEKTLKSLGI